VPSYGGRLSTAQTTAHFSSCSHVVADETSESNEGLGGDVP
jgi:hypothetical protein